MSESKKNELGVFPAIVIKVLDEYKIVINRGSEHGIKPGQRFLIYKLEEEPLVDPDTGENLGQLEIVRGTGRVIHVQERLSTIESDKKGSTERRIIKRKNPFSLALGMEEEIITPTSDILPFEDPKVGDKAKPI